MSAQIADEMTLSEYVAGAIRAEAARRGWTQSDLAKGLGMGRVRVSDRYRGVTPWTLDETQRAARLFGVPLVDLLPRLDSNQQPAGYASVQLADVVDLSAARTRRAA